MKINVTFQYEHAFEYKSLIFVVQPPVFETALGVHYSLGRFRYEVSASVLLRLCSSAVVLLRAAVETLGVDTGGGRRPLWCDSESYTGSLVLFFSLQPVCQEISNSPLPHTPTATGAKQPWAEPPKS